jgi:predicted MFS family arabinose efflux permease
MALKTYFKKIIQIQISLFGIGMLVCGVTGSILISLYVKKTLKYKLIFKICTGSAVILTILTNIMLNTIPGVFLSFVSVSLMGFLVTPILPLTYDIGC